METWAWLGAYVVGFALLQVYLYRYFIKDQSPREGTTTDGHPGGADHTHGVSHPSKTGGDDIVVCTNCGAYNRNSPMFSYCKECASALE